MKAPPSYDAALIMECFLPGSYDQPWTWEDEEADIRARVCLCCDEEGHYQQALEEHLAAQGRIDSAICLGNDGRIWDGHHRLIAGRKLGFKVPVEDHTDYEIPEEMWVDSNPNPEKSASGNGESRLQ